METIITCTPLHRLQANCTTGVFALRAGGILVNLNKGVPQKVPGHAKLHVPVVKRDIYAFLDEYGLTDRESYFRTQNGQLYTKQGTAHGFQEVAIKLREGGFRVVRDFTTFTTAYIVLKDGETSESLEELTGNVGLWSDPYKVGAQQFVTCYTASTAELEKALEFTEF